jgi:gluconolactonase
MSIIRLDPAMDQLLPTQARVEKLASGFMFIEGPLWRPSGVLWFSDVLGNLTRQWSPDGRVIELLNPGGYDGSALPSGGLIGPNGSTAGRDGAVLLCQHGNRRIVSIDRELRVSTVVDRFDGKRLNSPNDLVYRSDGLLYFTDPPYGLPMQDEDSEKELHVNGVYSLKDGRLRLLVDDMTRPNGLALSPDERTLYIANSDDNHRYWRRYDVAADGTLHHGRVFADVSDHPDQGLPDGMKIDSRGNVWATGPGGVWIFTPDGKHLGTIKPPEQPANCAWGDDGTTLYMTACTSLYRIKTAVRGQMPVYS